MDDPSPIGSALRAWRDRVRPEVGRLELDCDVLHVSGSDISLVAYTAAPGTEEAEKLRLLDVIGTQAIAPVESTP